MLTNDSVAISWSITFVALLCTFRRIIPFVLQLKYHTPLWTTKHRRKVLRQISMQSSFSPDDLLYGRTCYGSLLANVFAVWTYTQALIVNNYQVGITLCSRSWSDFESSVRAIRGQEGWPSSESTLPLLLCWTSKPCIDGDHKDEAADVKTDAI